MSGQYIAGNYTVTYDGDAVGQTLRGVYLSHEFNKRMIVVDEEGDAPVDAIYRGRNQFIEFEIVEANRAVLNKILEPYVSGNTPFGAAVIGQFDVGSEAGGTCPGAAKQIVMTAAAGTCAAAAGPTTMTFPLCIIAEGFPMRINFNTDLRQVPLRFRVYPNASGVYGTQVDP